LIKRNAAWFNCQSFFIESQFVSRGFVQRIEVCLQCYLEEIGQVYVYPAIKVRKGLDLACTKNWESNKRAATERCGEILVDFARRNDWAAELLRLFRNADSKKRHNLADTFLPYIVFSEQASLFKPGAPPAALPSPLPPSSTDAPPDRGSAASSP
jgi:hypothetical protein